jgi:putative tricarboxylic transport membrane protein
MAKDPSSFGKGNVAGIAAPEGANNAAAQTSFIPTLSLGVPGDAIMAIMLGALMIHGLVPGPQIIQNNPEFFWGLIASFWIGNLLLLILNLPLIGIWIRLLSIPYGVLFPAILSFIAIGIYSLHRDPFDLYLVAGAGPRRLSLHPPQARGGAAPARPDPEPARRGEPAAVAARLAGDPTIFLSRPISLAFLLLAAAGVAYVIYSALRARRRRSGLA